MKVYERYLAREIHAATAMVLAAFLMLFAFFDLIAEIQNLGRGNYQLPEALGYISLTLPGRAYELFPIAVLIGCIYALTTLARHSEITVLRASGLSTSRLLWTLTRIGLLYVVLTFVLGEFLAPPAERAGQQLRLRSMSTVVAQDFRSGLWVRDNHSFINVSSVSPDSRLQKLRVYVFDDNFRLEKIIAAEDGVYGEDGKWLLGNVVQTHFENLRSSVDRLDELQWTSALTPDILSVLLVAPERMSLINLYQYVRHLSDNRQKTERYEIAFWKKLIYPLSAMVMMALALPFGYLSSRTGGASLKIFIGVMLGIGFHMLNGLFSSLGAINEWRPFWSAVTPGVIFLAGAAVTLWWVERR